MVKFFSCINPSSLENPIEIKFHLQLLSINLTLIAIGVFYVYRFRCYPLALRAVEQEFYDREGTRGSKTSLIRYNISIEALTFQERIQRSVKSGLTVTACAKTKS